jgi:hypothetical protein
MRRLRFFLQLFGFGSRSLLTVILSLGLSHLLKFEGLNEVKRTFRTMIKRKQ